MHTCAMRDRARRQCIGHDLMHCCFGCVSCAVLSHRIHQPAGPHGCLQRVCVCMGALWHHADLPGLHHGQGRRRHAGEIRQTCSHVGLPMCCRVGCLLLEVPRVKLVLCCVVLVRYCWRSSAAHAQADMLYAACATMLRAQRQLRCTGGIVLALRKLWCVSALTMCVCHLLCCVMFNVMCRRALQSDQHKSCSKCKWMLQQTALAPAQTTQAFQAAQRPRQDPNRGLATARVYPGLEIGSRCRRCYVGCLGGAQV
jgi:hypothetical protein